MLLMIPLRWGVAKLLLRPFAHLALETSTLTAQKLSFRLNETRVSDEYGLLVSNFNLLFDRLETSFRQVRNFAVNASHEMRTPLAVIISQLERLLRTLSQDEQSSKEACQKSLNSALQLRNITNHLFLLAEVERMGDSQPVEAFQVNQVIGNALSHLKETQERLKKTVDWGKNVESCSFVGNISLFQSVVSNLIENALKYSKERIRIQTLQKNDLLSVVIEDDGPGIAPEERSRVFEPFYSQKKALEPADSGHGLGLAIVEACVRAQKGSIKLGDSELGGLSVQVSLPVF